MLIKTKISQLIKKASPWKEGEILIEKPENREYGDYSSNLAFILGKGLRKKPQKIALELKRKIENLPESKIYFQKIEAVNGFLNFYLSKQIVIRELNKILKEGEVKFSQKRKKANIEFISANPTGPLHIGNGRGAFFGDVLGNVFRKTGYSVDKEYYINDSVFSTQIKELGKTALGKGKSYLGPYLVKKIRENKQRIRKNWSVEQAGSFLAKLILKDIKKLVKEKLKIKFDIWTSESALLRKYQKKTLKFLKNLEKKDLVYHKEGAVWLKTSQFGDSQDWVLIRKDGTPTYLFSDLVYHYDKIQRGYNLIINIWGADHQAHVKKMEAVMKMLKFNGDFQILLTQMVKLKGGKKLSKRKGEIITLEELVNLVGLDAVRYFYLTKSLEAQMEFDLDLASEKSQRNPVYYIQYAYARINSILRKSKIREQKLKTSISPQQSKTLQHPSELTLMKELIRFPEILEGITKDYQVHHLTRYTLNLAGKFHRFYQDCQVLTSDKNLSQARLGLVVAVKIILRESLDLLGISKPRRM